MSTTIPAKKSFLIAAMPLFLVLFIDGMGLGLVFPLINSLIINPTSDLISHSLTLNTRNALFGLMIGIFMLCWFFGAAFLGDLSDQIGRKKSLFICLSGSLLGYFLSALAVTFNSYTLLIVGRVIAGFTSGSQPIAQAAIVDLSPEEHKARNIGFILFSISLGFVVGPLIGGILSDSTLISWFNYATPFYFSALLSFINIILLSLLFKETFAPAKALKKIRIYHAIEVLISGFRNKSVRALSIMFLILIFGWSSFYSFISLFLLKVHGYQNLATSSYMALMGLGFGVGSGFLVDYFSKRFSHKTSIITGLVVTAFFVLVVLNVNESVLLWLSVVPIGIFGIIAYSITLTIFSDQVDANSQGWIMGITGAIMAFAFGIDGLIVAPLTDFSPKIPLIISVCFLTLSAAVMLFIPYKKGANAATH